MVNNQKKAIEISEEEFIEDMQSLSEGKRKRISCFIDKKLKEYISLIDIILKWWKDHEFDVNTNGEDEYNVYDEPPDFVKEALRLKQNNKGDKQ